jgi:AraC family transcriptional regulator, activator of mtrCDE
MDALSHFLALYAPRGSLDVRCHLNAPWELEHQREAAGVASYHVVVAGEARLDMAGHPSVLLHAGDIVVFPRGSAHRLLAGSGAGSSAEAGTGADPAAPAPRDVPDAGLPVRVKANGGDGVSCDILCGRFVFDDAAGHALLAALPEMLLVRSADKPEFCDLRALIAMLRRETGAMHRGGAVLVSQLSSVLFGLLIRAWTDETQALQGMLGALAERRLQPALLGMFAEPARQWTLEDMARACHMSRATFVRLFHQASGTSAALMLLQIRMANAARWLARGGRSIAAVAMAAGYQSDAAFARAFKKHFGVGPGAYRRGPQAAAYA